MTQQGPNDDVIVVLPQAVEKERRSGNDSTIEALRKSVRDEVAARMDRDRIVPVGLIEVEVIVRARGVGYKRPDGCAFDNDEFARLAKAHDGKRPLAVVRANYGAVKVEG